MGCSQSSAGAASYSESFPVWGSSAASSGHVTVISIADEGYPSQASDSTAEGIVSSSPTTRRQKREVARRSALEATNYESMKPSPRGFGSRPAAGAPIAPNYRSQQAYVTELNAVLKLVEARPQVLEAKVQRLRLEMDKKASLAEISGQVPRSHQQMDAEGEAHEVAKQEAPGPPQLLSL